MPSLASAFRTARQSVSRVFAGQRTASRLATPPLPVPNVTPFRSMGVNGVTMSAGYVMPVERNADWIGQNKYRTASEIVTNVSIVAASVHYFVNLVAHPQWKVVPRDENSASARDKAELVEEMMYDMDTPWTRIIR